MSVDVTITPFNKELDFEKALADLLPKHGWELQVIKNPTEKDLIRNWAAIIYNNNRDVNRLGDFPLTETEMQQVMNQVNALKNPYEVNQFIKGGLVHIKRDNTDDKINCGREVYLKIFDAAEISTGQSTYQIVRQPKFETKHPLASTRRGDLQLLINGMPVVHIELKRSGVDVSQAVNQIKRYTHEGVFSRGIFSLVQIFVAMTPEKTLYFANPGAAERFSPSFYFHWADFNNEEEHNWRDIARNLLSIPMAHQMVGYYTIADDKDETLKVLRSYQYFAVTKIWERVKGTLWDDHKHKGGYIWHTTGSGKTMTSFKSAQLIAKANDADKVVFLLDRIELSTQSVDEYRGFANADDNVLDTEDTRNLVRILESDSRDDSLIVTSIQKMSRITSDHNIPQSTIAKINKKRVVFIVDECHRSVNGTGSREGNGSGMLLTIKRNFPRALLFGFTGTPIFEDNAHGEITTGVIFGDELHKYTLAHGIPDGNVLGFDKYREETFPEHDIREAVALRKADQNAKSFDDIKDDKAKVEIYDKWMNDTDMLKVEDEAKSLYQSEQHHLAVMHKIVEERPRLSRNGMFHAILATKNIPEAIEYYHLFKTYYPEYNVTAIFDDSIDNNGGGEYKEDAILEILEDYNGKFDTTFQQSTYVKYKKDVAKRLAHKAPYQNLEKEKQLDLLIVVTQMLTGYDSKWVNTLYVDKLLQYVDVIQAFSRTNRLFGPEKPFGIIKYFTRPERMTKNIDEALELYVDQPLTVFTDKLEANIEKINAGYHTIDQLFKAEGIDNYATLPKAEASRKKFAKEFCEMTKRIEASKMQGFTWDVDTYEFQHSTGYVYVKVEIDEQTYKVLLQRYRELFQKKPGSVDEDVYELEAYITETGTGTIDAEYINSKFTKFVKNLYKSGPDSDEVKRTQKELQYSFASLSQQDQRTAMRILHDIESGDLRISKGMTINDYIKEYQKRQCDQMVYALHEATGLDLHKLQELVAKVVDENDINEQGRFDELIKTWDKEKVSVFLKRVTGKDVKNRFLITELSSIVRRFVLYADDRTKIIFAYQNDGFYLDLNIPDELPEEEPQNHTANENVVFEVLKVKQCVKNILEKSLAGVSDGMRPMNEIADSVFFVLAKESIESLDSVGMYISRAFSNIFLKKSTIVDKHVAFNLLVTKFEAYLKKLFYLMKNREVKPQYDGDDVTWKDVIFAFDPLRVLKYSDNENSIRLSQYLSMIKGWRNEESHISPTSTEKDIDKAIEIVLTMYFYVTGSCITDLESNGHDVEDECIDAYFKLQSTSQQTIENHYHINGNLNYICTPYEQSKQ